VSWHTDLNVGNVSSNNGTPFSLDIPMAVPMTIMTMATTSPMTLAA